MHSDRVQVVFRIVVVAAVVAAFGQVALGGVVRVTESGLGCPDWPLCHGKIIPPFDTATLIEYSHRLSASVLGLFVAATAVIAWFRLRGSSYIVLPSIAALVFVIVAAVLGGVTVLTELAWWGVLFHLGIAELLLACLTIAAIASWDGNMKIHPSLDPAAWSGTRWLVVAAVVGTFVLILSGSYMVGFGAGTSCATWPLCRGSLLPEGAAYAIHMGHRYLAAAVGLTILAAAWQVWRSAGDSGPQGFAAASVVVAFAVQIVVGTYVVWSGFTAELKALHLSLATLVWVALVGMATVWYLPRRSMLKAETALTLGRA